MCGIYNTQLSRITALFQERATFASGKQICCRSTFDQAVGE